MKFSFSLLALALALPTSPAVQAQSFTNLYNFTGGIDGAYPESGLVLSGNTLYGTALDGGANGNGTVFAISADGNGFSTLFSFAETDTNGVNFGGANPYAGLILSGNALYGMAYAGGASGCGTVFTVNTDGTGQAILRDFAAFPPPYTAGTNADGATPVSALILSGNTLYGTAYTGGAFGGGTVFAVNIDGTGFTTLHNFTPVPPYPGPFTNGDGSLPQAGLALTGGTLYGTTSGGGGGGGGTVFAVNIDGSGFTTLHTFSKISELYGTNSDGAMPLSGLVASERTLFGTAYLGGVNGVGAVFALSMDGTGFMNLHSFADGANTTNSDGAYPVGGLVLSGATLYGTASHGGENGNGTVFALNADGAGFTNLYSFSESSTSDGASPLCGLILSGDTLYGTTRGGGANGYGTLFGLSLGSTDASPPSLAISRSGTDVVLTWPANSTGFTLQSTTNLTSGLWSTVSPPPALVNGWNSVTNPISGAQCFFRLSQ